jgi:hypothetical protein
MKFSIPELAFYLMQIVLHSQHACRFTALHRSARAQGLTDLGYAGFMKNIHACAPLAGYLSLAVIVDQRIQPDGLTLLDTSLLPAKKAHCITSKDWARGRVTTRKNKADEKVRVCGHKGLFILNGKSQIMRATLLPINFSDQNILKDSAFYAPFLADAVVLADRGFNNSRVRERLQTIEGCRFISPPTSKNQLPLSEEDRALYKARWAIETLFQRLKDELGEFKLVLSGVRKPAMVLAKFYLAVVAYNITVEA